MTTLYLKYNPYTVNCEIKIDGRPVQAPNRLADWQYERLQVWVEELMSELENICNDDEYLIEFYGTAMDYNDLQTCVKEYCRIHSDIKVEIQFTEAKSAGDRFKALKQLFDEMQEDCPFEDLRTEQIKENFKNAIGSEFEVSVIATMSSGKSTLINSFLGRELMPSKNEACTATIAKIRDVDGMDHFTGEYKDKDNHLLGRYDDLTLEDMNKMNENPNTAFIDIQGDILNIDSKGVKLVLVDTPGPNNSRTEEHKNHTYRVIREKTKPMVLYVLNATQLQTNDDKELLTAVADAMRVGGKQSKDRFLFAVNKVDLFDPDKESVKDAIENVKEYLGKFDIHDPNIFPTSAEMAKVIRMEMNGQKLTSAQQRTLRDYDFFIEEEQLHLSEQASLSKENRNRIEEMLRKAREDGREKDEALVHTGIPAIELAIDEYLKKYAYTAKIKTAVDTFKKKVEEKDMHTRMMKAIQNDEESRKHINEQLNFLKTQLQEGREASRFKQRIQNIDMMKDAEKRIRKLRAKITSSLIRKDQKSKLTTLEVQQLMMALNNKVYSLQSDIKTELEEIIDDVIIDNAQSIIKEYREHIHGLITSGDLAGKEYEKGNGINFLEAELPDAQETINKYKYNEEYDTGEKEWVVNTSKKWYKPWTWFQPAGYYMKVYANREMVDYEVVYNDFIQPVIANFLENLDRAKQTAKEESERFKTFFLKELEELDEAMQKKVEENEMLTRNRENIEVKLNEEKQKVEWLESFMAKLDEVLEI